MPAVAQCPDGSPPPCRRPGAAVAPSPNSVAVLYFDSRSSDSNDLYLADGLTEEIINRLSGIERVTVRSRFLVRRFRGATLEDPAALGRALNVTYLVSGSVRRAGGRLRLSAELIRAAGGAQVWGRQFDQAGGDVFAVQEAVAREVASGIVGRLLPSEVRALAIKPTENVAAFEAVTRGNFHMARRDSAGISRAIQEYERALRLDPNYTDALSRMGFAYGVAHGNGIRLGIPLDSVAALATRAATEAVSRAPNSSDAWLAMGMARIAADPRRHIGAIEALQRAIALDSTSAEPHHMMGFTMGVLDLDSGGLVHDRQALAINPARPVTILHFTQYELLRGHYVEALRWTDSALAVDPDFALARMARAVSFAATGDAARARAEVARWSALPQLRVVADLAQAALDASGPDSTARRHALAAAVPAEMSTSQGAYLAMFVMAQTHDPDAVMTILNAARPRGVFLRYFMRTPVFDSIRNDPRFAALYREVSP